MLNDNIEEKEINKRVGNNDNKSEELNKYLDEENSEDGGSPPHTNPYLFIYYINIKE